MNCLFYLINQRRYFETIGHMNMLLDLRLNSGRPIHLQELRVMTVSITQLTVQHLRSDPNNISVSSLSSATQKNSASIFPPLAASLEALLIRITNTIKSDALIWEILAAFYQSFVIDLFENNDSYDSTTIVAAIVKHSKKSFIDCRVKQV